VPLPIGVAFEGGLGLGARGEQAMAVDSDGQRVPQGAQDSVRLGTQPQQGLIQHGNQTTGDIPPTCHVIEMHQTPQAMAGDDARTLGFVGVEYDVEQGPGVTEAELGDGWQGELPIHDVAHAFFGASSLSESWRRGWEESGPNNHDSSNTWRGAWLTDSYLNHRHSNSSAPADERGDIHRRQPMNM
jgi:hypothetical protein